MYSNHLTDQQPSCEICQKKFSDKYTLNRHKATHAKDKTSFNCIECSKAFSRKDALQRHRITHGILKKGNARTIPNSIDDLDYAPMKFNTEHNNLPFIPYEKTYDPAEKELSECDKFMLQAINSSMNDHEKLIHCHNYITKLSEKTYDFNKSHLEDQQEKVKNLYHEAIQKTTEESPPYAKEAVDSNLPNMRDPMVTPLSNIPLPNVKNAIRWKSKKKLNPTELMNYLQHINLYPPHLRKELLQKVSDDYIKAICICCDNMLEGNIPCTEEEKKTLSKHRYTIRKLANPKIPLPEKRKRLVQKGGFLSTLLPTALSLLTSLIHGIR